MKQLPKYFVIKIDRNNPLWDKYIDWLNETYKQCWCGTTLYYGYDGNAYFNGTNHWNKINNFENNPEEITLEYWDECVNGNTCCTSGDKFVEGEEVYVSNISEDDALKCKDKRIYLTTIHGNSYNKYACVYSDDENSYKEGNDFYVNARKYITKIPKSELIELTTKDGQTISIKKEKAIELGFNF